MTAKLHVNRQGLFQYILCVLVGIFCGGILLLEVSDKWKFALICLVAAVVLIIMLGCPKRILLLLVASTIPFYLGKALIARPEHTGLIRGVGINLSHILALALFLLFLGRLALGRTKIRFFPLITVPALAWIIVSSFSLLAARDVDLALFQLINMSQLLLLSWVVANSLEDDQDLRWLIWGLILGFLCQGLMGIYQGVTGKPLGLGFLGEVSDVFQQTLSVGIVNRVQGTLGHPNAYAIYLTTVMPFALALVFSKTRRSLKALASISLLAGCVALIFSLSRSAWAGLLGTLIIVLVLAARGKRISTRMAVMLTGMTSLFIIALIFIGPDLILSRLTSDDRGSAQSRITLAKGALAIIQNHPLFGIGLNNYSLVSSYYDQGNFVGYGQKAPIVHNVYLLVAAETGLIGLTVFLLFLAVLLSQAWRIIDQASNDYVWVAGVGIFSAFIVLAVRSMVDYDLISSLQVFTQFFLLAGISARLSQDQSYEVQVSRQVHYHLNAMMRDFHSET